MSKNNLIITVIIISLLLILGISIFINEGEKNIIETQVVATPNEIESEPELETPTTEIIGNSVEGRAIETYTYGKGSTTLLFVGGIHGGYEWNSSLLAYEFIDNLENGSVQIPNNLKVVIIPTLNPDGLYSVIKKSGRFTKEEIPINNAHETGEGRFNANGVDLNRNFDCKWKAESTWRGRIVSAGTKVFSEPEAVALRDLVLKLNPRVVVFWHSQANTVYASECEDGVLSETLNIMHVYAESAGYNFVSKFDAYPVTGDAEGWLASINIPAITVELKTRTSPEWEQNRLGIEALLNYYKERD